MNGAGRVSALSAQSFRWWRSTWRLQHANKTQLLSKKVVPQATCDKVKDSIVAKQAAK